MSLGQETLSYKFVVHWRETNLFLSYLIEIENESLNRELEKQFNEGLQSQILHDYYEDLACHPNQCKTSPESHTTHRQYFVPATTDTQSLKPWTNPVDCFVYLFFSFINVNKRSESKMSMKSFVWWYQLESMVSHIDCLFYVEVVIDKSKVWIDE